MPANLTPQYLDAEQRYKSANTTSDKLAVLEEMFALIPKHKGTEKLQAEIKRKISQARKELQQKKGPKRLDPSNIPREGAGRLVLVGPPNGGKSALLKATTNAEPEVAPYAFTTREPEQGMVEWEDVQIQLIDLPALSRQHMEPWVMNLVRSADLLLLVVDPSDPAVLEELEESEAILNDHKVYLRPTEGELPRGGVVLPALVVLNKLDLPGAGDNAAAVQEFFGGRYAYFAVSAEGGQGIAELKEHLFRKLDRVRVYTKQPGKPAEMGRPYVLKTGSTVMDLCGLVHHDFVEGLKFARVWGKAEFEGQRVNRDYELADGDVIELHR